MFLHADLVPGGCSSRSDGRWHARTGRRTRCWPWHAHSCSSDAAGCRAWLARTCARRWRTCAERHGSGRRPRHAHWNHSRTSAGYAAWDAGHGYAWPAATRNSSGRDARSAAAGHDARTTAVWPAATGNAAALSHFRMSSLAIMLTSCFVSFGYKMSLQGYARYTLCHTTAVLHFNDIKSL